MGIWSLTWPVWEADKHRFFQKRASNLNCNLSKLVIHFDKTGQISGPCVGIRKCCHLKSLELYSVNYMNNLKLCEISMSWLKKWETKSEARQLLSLLLRSEKYKIIITCICMVYFRLTSIFTNTDSVKYLELCVPDIQ